jgi:16S rRNA (uracil1498-N3)-methyltransferase
MIRSEKHEFALQYKDLPIDIKIGTSLAVADSEMVRRALSVLRLAVGDTVCFFNMSVSSSCKITSIQKRSFECVIQTVSKIILLQPFITLMLPLLKREALESAVYNATAMGVGTIQLLTTEKSAHWSGAKELDRLQRVAVAAAEQSKQFALPKFIEPISLGKFFEASLTGNALMLHADVDGAPLSSLVADFSQQSSFVISVGPEGDLTKQERDLLVKNNCTFVRLTPTVLKAEEAASLLIGIVRSFT